MILSFLFYAFLAYLLFRLVFNFVIPVYKTTKRVKKTFREMKEQMNNQENGFTTQPQQEKKTTSNKKSTLGEYIDFEEMKD
jgi:uncharacterized membrane-anchored protein YitT (DUF2179 family)